MILHEEKTYLMGIKEITPCVGRRPGGSIINTNLKVDFVYKEKFTQKEKLTVNCTVEGFVR